MSMEVVNFEKNVKRWALLNPKEAEQLLLLQCNHIFLSKTDNGLYNIIQEKNGENFCFYEGDPKEEAKNWFLSLDLKGIKALYVFGVGLGYYYEAAIEWLQNSEHFLIFLEDDLEVIHRLLETEIGKQLLFDKQVRLQYFDKEDSFDNTWQMLAELFCRLPFRLSALKWYEKQYSNLLPQIHAKISFWNNINSAIISEYMDSFGQHFFVNFFQNLNVLPESYQANGLFDQFKGVPAIICGAGPSLEKNLSLLETLSHRALIFAGGTAMNAVNARGFLPHFGLGIDPNEEQLTRIIMNKAYEIPFLYRGRIYHKALDLVQAHKLYVTGSGSFSMPEWFEKQLDIEGKIVDEGFNVINFSLSLAHALGCNPIIFVGVDLAYSEGLSYYPGVIQHPTHIRRDFRTKGIHEELLIKDDIYGNPVNTLWKWVTESAWLAKFVQDHQDTLFVNATEGGLGIYGVPNKPLSEVAQHLLLRQFDLHLCVHGEIQNNNMPAAVSLKHIKELINELCTNLQKCQNLCKVLQEEFQSLAMVIEVTPNAAPTDLMTDRAKTALSELEEEFGYKYLLKDFDRTYSQSIKLPLQQISYDPDLSISRASILQADLQFQRYQLLHDVAITHMALMQLITIEEERKIQTRASEEESFHNAQKPANEEENYSFQNGTLVIKDSELGISIQESGVECLPDNIYYPNGTIKLEQFFLDGVLHGPVTFFSHEGSVLAKSWYAKGVQEGKTQYYYHSGALYSLQRFRQGLLEGVQNYYYSNGNLKTLLNYLNGQLHGEIWLYYPNGAKKRQLYFVHGKRHGMERMWSHEGVLVMEAEFDNDRPIGKAKTWYDDGLLFQEITYGENFLPLAIQRWTPHGLLIPESETIKDDYFEAVTKQTGALTHSLENVYEQLSQVAGLLFPVPSQEIQKDFKELKKELEHLEKINQNLLYESGLNAENPKEAIWKSPASRQELQSQLEEITGKLMQDINQMQEVVKEIKEKQKKEI